MVAPTASTFAQVLNLPPIAVDQILFVNEDTPLNITLLASDLNGDELIYSVVDDPNNGTLSGTAPDLTYTPNANFSGPDSFSFNANDGTVDSNNATVSITVNDQPTADNQSVSTDEEMPVAVTLTGSDVEDGSTLTYTVTASPINGTLSGTAPDLTYTPNANFSGSDGFKFTVKDSENFESDEAMVSVTVNSVNNNPVADSQTVSTDEDTALPITLTATDLNGDALTYSVADSPIHGILSGTAPDLVYSPNANYNGPDSFSFNANDGTVDSNNATVSITVTAVNDAPIAMNDVFSTAENTTLVIAGPGVLGNDTDIDLEALSAVLDTSPSSGNLTLNANGSFTYSPETNFNGTDSFTYHANDGSVDSNIATVSIIVNAANANVNQPPEANAGPDQTVDERTTVTLNGGASSDGDGNITAFSWTQMDGPSVTLSNATVDSPSFVAPSVDADTDLTFNLTVTDNDGAIDSDLVTVTVENVPRRSGGGGGGGGGSSSGSGGGSSIGVITDSTAPTVTVSPPEGKYKANLLVSLRSNEADAIIRYTTNGIDPTVSSPEYSTPISLSADTTLKFFGTDSSGNSGAITTAVYDINILHMQNLETNGTGWGIYSTRPVLAEYVSSSSVLVGKYIDSITIDLKKSAGATGTAEIGVINPDLTMKKLFATLDISTLSETGYLPNKFNLTGENYLIQAGDRIGVKYTAGSSDGSHVSIMRDTNTADPFDGNNTYLSYYTTSWTNQTTFDLVMTLEYSGKNPLSMPASYFLLNPLSKIMVLGSSFFNAEGTSVLQGAVGEEIQLSTTLQNSQQNSQNYTYLVAILDENGVAVDVSAQASTVEAGQSIVMYKSWLPLDAGTYAVKTFVWDETSESPIPLSSVSERTILVV